MTGSSSKLLEIQGKWYRERKPKKSKTWGKKNKNYSTPVYLSMLDPLIDNVSFQALAKTPKPCQRLYRGGMILPVHHCNLDCFILCPGPPGVFLQHVPPGFPGFRLETEFRNLEGDSHSIKFHFFSILISFHPHCRFSQIMCWLCECPTSRC